MVNKPLLVARAFGYRLHHAIEVEATGFLARRKFLEALRPLANIRASRREHEHVIHPPLVVAYTFMLVAFERIHTQICQHRCMLCCVWLSPDHAQ